MSNIDVLQSAAWFLPYGLGGTEIYVADLMSALRKLGIKSAIVVPRSDKAPERYEHDRFVVETYPVNADARADEFREGKPHDDFDRFRRHLSKYRDAIYHQHSWTRGCGPLHLRAAREAGLRTIVTVHVPANICLRGSMLRNGQAQCEGYIDPQVCGACWGNGQGMPGLVARSVVQLPFGVSEAIRRSPAGSLATALGARALAERKRGELREMVDNADRVVAVCQWLYDALIANGAPASKVVLNRQGLSSTFLDQARNTDRRPTTEGEPLRLLYLGRWDRGKGIDVAIRAVLALPSDVAVKLSIRAARNDSDPGEYETHVRALAGTDPRIEWVPPMPRERLSGLMAEHDVLLVPSISMETGPLVVLEAQAVGLFVVGTRMGGIAELVKDGDGGTLVSSGDVGAWRDAIADLARKHAQGRLATSKRAVRGMDTAAGEMAELYRSLQ
jgi:glycosyltransferase involved in cell wall biosynthesis